MRSERNNDRESGNYAIIKIIHFNPDYKPATTMLYFLIFIVPFVALMFYLTDRNRHAREKYNALLQRLFLMVSGIPSMSSQLEALSPASPLTYADIKTLETILQNFENELSLKSSKFIANTFNSRLKQLDFIEKKLARCEKTIREREKQKDADFRLQSSSLLC